MGQNVQPFTLFTKDKKLIVLLREDIVLLWRENLIETEDYIFCHNDQCWLNVGNLALEAYQGSGVFPDFIPPPIPPGKGIYSINEAVPIDTDQYQRHRPYRIDFSAPRKIIHYITKIKKVVASDNNDELLQQIEILNNKNKELSEQMEEKEKKLAQYASQVKIAEVQKHDLEKRITQYKNIHLAREKKFFDKYESVKQKYMLIKEQDQEHIRRIKKLSLRLKQFKNLTTELKRKLAEKSPIKKQVEEFNDTTEVIRLDQITKEQVINRTENKEQSEEEINKLIGDCFEVSNASEWKFKNGDGIKGPFTFGEMLEFKEQGLFDKETEIKNINSPKWQNYHDVFELKTEIITINDKDTKRYFIKRGHFRAPFHEIVSFLMNAKDIRGHCTSLSLGGAFIELNKIDHELIQVGKEIEMRFSKGALPRPLYVKAIIRNISESRPKGIGVQFVALSDDDREMIVDYINICLEKLSDAA